MRILSGFHMKYSNTDCLENNLQYSGTFGFNAKFVQNNCITTRLDNSYINLGASANLYNVKAISFKHKARSITSNNAFFTGFRETPICFIISATQNTLVLGNGYNSAHNWKIGGMTDLETVNYLRDGNWHQYYVEINDSNLAECIVKIDGLNCVTSWVPYINVGTTTDTLFGCWVSSSGPTYNIDGSICDIKLYDSNNELIHWYPCAEGAGNTVYDAIGNINGNLYSAQANVFWGQTQDIFAYNTIYGYGKISNSDALIPLNPNLGLSFTAQYPKKQNGHNFSEAKLDWSCNTENIPELSQLTGVNNYATGTTVAGIYKKSDNTTGESNFLLYSTEQVGDNLNRINNILKYR